MRETIENILTSIEVEYKTQGNGFNQVVKNAAAISEANQNSIVWIDPKRKDKNELLLATKACLIIGDLSLCLKNNSIKDKILVQVKNPRTTFAKILTRLIEKKIVYEINKTAIIHPDAVINKRVSIGPNTYIGKCKISEGTIIEGNCYIYNNVQIGENVLIKAGAVIGGDGFGYVEDEDGSLIHFPHIGGVIIRDNVSIGSNTCIDKGTLGNTLIENNVKIDNLVHIAHNVKISENCFITANTTIAGSAVINSKTWLSPSSTILDGIKIGSNSIIGAGAVQLKNAKKDTVYFGNPAVNVKVSKKTVILSR